MRKRHVLILLGTALAVVMAVFASSAASRPARAAADDPNNANLTYWYWGEDDAPGANGWLKQEVALYEKAHPKVKITVVTQSTDTLTSAFTTAAQTKSGPDIATQWATLPVLTPAWNGASVPISDYVPASETKNWIGTAENMSGGKLWGMPQYLLGIPFLWNKAMFKKAGLNPNKGPKTWAEFMADAKKLKAAGFTPFGMGNKDGYGGAWFFANMELQNLDSLAEWVDAIVAGTKLSEEKYTGWYELLDELVQKKYFNDSVNSLKLDQGHAIFSRGESAMSLGTDGIVGQWQKDLGAEKVGVMKMPRFADGALSQGFNATQSISHFICKWSKNKEEAAAFLRFMHTPERIKRWYELTGVGVADRRFDASVIKDPVLKQMYEWETTGPQVWLENYNPVQVDSEANIPAGQTIFSRSGSPEEASQLWVQVARRWQSQQPEQYKDWQNWEPAEPAGI